jgi:hypothetical protein
MFLPLLAFSSYLLLLIGSARAQVSAPNCTNESFNTWVGSFCAGFRFVLMPKPLFAPYWLFDILVAQFSRSKSLLGCCVPGVGMQQWRLVHVPLIYRVWSYWRFAAFSIPALLPQNSYTGPNGIDNNDPCKCNTVVYNLISACDACQGASWILCVDLLLVVLHSNQHYNSSVTTGPMVAPPSQHR